jgi:hypothetical protein
MAVRAPFTARRLVETIRREMNAGEEDFALRMVVTAATDLRRAAASGDRQTIAGFLTEPPSTGSDRWDRLLAGTVAATLRRAGIPAPAWTRPQPPAEAWYVGDPTPLIHARIRARTPPELAQLGVFLDGKAFETA